MFNLQKSKNSNGSDFGHLPPETLYFDSACQTMRPQCVIDVQVQYFQEFNACGGRVKYPWGEKVDALIAETRQKFLSLLGFKSQDYSLAFTLNTTYGINLVLSQIKAGQYNQIVTSEIEHNSVFLPTITYAKTLGLKRVVLKRAENGELIFDPKDLEKSLVVINAMSNFDGQKLLNLKDLVKQAHAVGGRVLIDAAQAMAHGLDVVRGAEVDTLFASSHKMYGPSLGVVAIKKDFLQELDLKFIGGGTVEDVSADNFSLIGNNDELHSLLEPGLQNFSGIIGLNQTLDWLKSLGPEDQSLSAALFDGLKSIPGLQVINTQASPIISVIPKIDSHRLAAFLAEQNIMVRSGYFCCHYYLKNLKNYPPLVRFSLGRHNTLSQVKQMLEVLTKIINNT
jgi:selenocysteine lyase/cysteine desulfurase